MMHRIAVQLVEAIHNFHRDLIAHVWAKHNKKIKTEWRDVPVRRVPPPFFLTNTPSQPLSH